MPSPDTLLAAAQRLVAAQAHYEADRSAVNADEVIAARLRLQEVFVEAGWMPPRYRQEEMLRDRLIVQQQTGVSEDIEQDAVLDGAPDRQSLAPLD